MSIRRKSQVVESEVKKGLDDHRHSSRQSDHHGREESLIEEVIRLSVIPV